MANRVPGPLLAPGGKARWPYHRGPNFLLHYPVAAVSGTRMPKFTFRRLFPRPAVSPTDTGSGGGGTSGPPPITTGQLYPRPDSIG